MVFLNFLFGGGTTKQTYVPSKYEIDLFNQLRPFLDFGTARGEGQLAMAPQIRGLENFTRQSLAPLGSAQQFQGGLDTKIRIQDLLNQYALSRQQQAGGTLAGLVSGKGTQVTQQPLNFAGLGQLIGLLLSGGIKLPGLGGNDSFFGTSQTPAFQLNR